MNKEQEMWTRVLGEEWHSLLESEIKKEYFSNLRKFLTKEYRENTVYPEKKDVFNAFKLTQPSDIKVVIVGQDCYHTKDVAHGLAFSTKQEKTPPSLRNIFREIEGDVGDGLVIEQDNNLERWAKQGVFLINTCLTVRQSKPLSHSGKGWETFISEALHQLCINHKNIIFMLWGKNAQDTFKNAIDLDEHYQLVASHPSPFSAHRGYFGCKHFSQANKILDNLNKEQIQWI